MLEVGWWGSLRDLSKNMSKQGGEGKNCSQGRGGFEGVINPAPPSRKILIIRHGEKLPRQGGIPGVVQRVTRLSKLPPGQQKKLI